MRKSILTCLAVILALNLFAVDLPKQGFGLQIGWAQPILRLNEPTYSIASKDSLGKVVKLNGFKVGLVYDASYIAGFGSSMGINYTFGASNSGWYADNRFGMDYPRSRQLITYHEMEVFVDWQYKFEIAKETYLILTSGPTLQVGIGLNMRFEHQQFEDQPYEPRYYSGFANEVADQSFKRINVTWGVGAGFQYRRYFLRGGYDFGLIIPYKNGQFETTNYEGRNLYTRGRLDQWSIKIGMYLWYND